MFKGSDKSGSDQITQMMHIYDELIDDMERIRKENKNLADRIVFYKTLLQKIPTLFFIIHLERKSIKWRNDEFAFLEATCHFDEPHMVEQIRQFYSLQQETINETHDSVRRDPSNHGIFKIRDAENREVSYYFKGYTLTYGEHGQPREVFITAFNLTEKLKDDYKQEQLIQENKRLKHKLAAYLLTNREKEIIQLIFKGFTSKRIAVEMGISYFTVETHRKNILRKIELHSTAELIRFAMEAGLV